MLFNLIFLILFAAIAYFHYAQGLFSATLSALLCILAATLAVGYHELLTPYLMKLPEMADAISLVGIFVVAYVVPRLLFDNLIPGNVRYPLLMDKIGAGVMGVVAGLFASGILALAVQTLPFGPAIGGYSRQELQDRGNVVVPGEANSTGRAMDSAVTDELVGDRLGDPAHQSRMWLHQDDLVVGMAAQLSAAGASLDNSHSLAAVHPDYLTELFGQRLGLGLGAKHLAINDAKSTVAKASAAYILPKLAAGMSMDSELAAVRGDEPLPDLTNADVPSSLVVVRIAFTPDPDATDTDGYLRLSPGVVRLKTGSRDYYPVGTLVGGQVLLRNRGDDPIVIDLKSGPKSVDFVFVVATDDLNVRTEDKEKKTSFASGSFVQVKRYAQSDVSGMELASGPPANTTVESATDVKTNGTLGGVLRKNNVADAAIKLLGGIPASRSRSGNRSNNSGNSNNSNDLLPTLPNHLMGL